MSKSKYNYYNPRSKSYEKSKGKRSSKSVKRSIYISEFDELKEDTTKVFSDIKNIFCKKTNSVFKFKSKQKVKKNSKEILVRNACIGVLCFAVMSFVLTFPIALIIALVMAGLYFSK